MDRVADFESEGCGFESRRARQIIKRHLIEVPLDIQRDKAFWWLSEGFNERFYCHLGLFQDTSQCTDGQFAVQGHDASHRTVWGLFLEYDVATSLPHLLKAQPF